MKTSHKPFALQPALAGLIGLAALGLGTSSHAAEERARVISTTPVIEQVAVPREVCRDETVMVEARKSGAGALVGGIAGGAMGNAIGNGNGRAIATVIGLIGGAMVGDRIEGGGQPQAQTVRQCHTRTVYENQTMAYDVVYEYAGKRYAVQMDRDPGPYVQLNISPMGRLDPAPAPARYRSGYDDDSRTVSRVQVGTVVYPPAPEVVYIGGQRGWGNHRGDRYGDRHGGWRGERWDR